MPSGQAAGMLLGRLLLPEPTHRFGEKPMLLLYFVISIGLQLVFWLVPNIIAGATALSIMGFFQGPFFATVSAEAAIRGHLSCVKYMANTGSGSLSCIEALSTEDPSCSSQ